MYYYDERKKNFFANENLDTSQICIKQNISLRKEAIKEKIFIKRLNYSNNKIESILEINPSSLEISVEEKSFKFNEMNEENINILLQFLSSYNLEHVKLALFTFRNFTIRFPEFVQPIFIDSRIVNMLFGIFQKNTNKNILYELYWIFINLSTYDMNFSFEDFDQKELLVGINKHLNLEVDSISEEILWFLNNIMEEASLDFFKNFIESKLIDSILNYFYKDEIQESILKNLLKVLKNLLIKTIDKIILSDHIYHEIIKIVTAYIYHKSDTTLKLCLEILLNLTGSESNEFSHKLLNTGIISKLLKFDKLFIGLEVDSNNIKEPDKHKIDFPKKILLMILRIIGNLLAFKEENDIVEDLMNLGLLNFITNYYDYDFDDIKKSIVLICSNIVVASREYTLELIKSPVFSMIIETLNESKNLKLIEEILWFVANILAHSDSEIAFSFFNYQFMQNLLNFHDKTYSSSNIFLHLLFLNVFKLIFKIENDYRFKEEKNHNFDDNELNFIQYFVRHGGIEILSTSRNKNNHLDVNIDDIQIEINKRFNNTNNGVDV